MKDPIAGIRAGRREALLPRFPGLLETAAEVFLRTALEPAKEPDQAPHPLSPSQGVRIRRALRIQALPSRVQRGRGVVAEKTERGRASKQAAVDFELAQGRQGSHEGARAAPHLLLSEGRSRRPEAAHRDSQVVKPLGISRAQRAPRVLESAKAQMPERV
jgi:hypothetical protein